MRTNSKAIKVTEAEVVMVAVNEQGQPIPVLPKQPA